jgi:hypothetical protein
MTQKELIQVQADLRKLQVERDFWKARADTFAKLTIPKSAVEERISQDSLIAKRQSDLARLREDLVLAKNKITAKNSTVIDRVQTEIAVVERDIESLKQSLRLQLTELMRERAQDEFNGKMTQFQEQIDLIKEMEKTLEAEVKKLSEETRAIRPSHDQRLTQIEAELRELRATVAELKRGK